MKKTLTKSMVMSMLLIGMCLNLIAEDDILTAAVFPFTERGSGRTKQGEQVADLLFAGLAENPNIWLIERQDMKKILDEAELNLSGAVNPSQANQIGQLTGAKVIITGSVFKVKDKTFLVAKIISAETSRVFGCSENGTSGIDDLSAKLAKKVSSTMQKNTKNLVAEVKSKKDIVAELKEKLKNFKKPKVYITVKEQHIGQAVIDPAVETELLSVCKDVGFAVTESENDADVVIKGEGFSEFATRRGNLISVKARVELKAVDKKKNVLAADKQTDVEVGLAEKIVGKNALQKAALTLAERILPKIVSDKK